MFITRILYMFLLLNIRYELETFMWEMLLKKSLKIPLVSYFAWVQGYSYKVATLVWLLNLWP